MAEENDLTAQNPGTGDSPTPAVATDAPDATSGEPQAAPPEETVPKSRYVASTQEAQRLYQENQRLNNLLQYYSQQPPQPAPQPQHSAPATEGLDDGMAAELLNAVLDKKPETVKKFGRTLVEQAKREVMTDIMQQATTGQRIGSSVQFIRENLADPNAPVAQKAWTRYQQMIMDPSYIGMVQPDLVPWGNARVNPHLLRMAIIEAKGDVNGKMRQIDGEARAAAETFVEPSQPKAPPKATEFNPMKHLTKEERIYCDKSGMTYKRYWDHLDKPGHPKLTAARLKEGKPLSYKQIL